MIGIANCKETLKLWKQNNTHIPLHATHKCKAHAHTCSLIQKNNTHTQQQHTHTYVDRYTHTQRCTGITRKGLHVLLHHLTASHRITRKGRHVLPPIIYLKSNWVRRRIAGEAPEFVLLVRLRGPKRWPVSFLAYSFLTCIQSNAAHINTHTHTHTNTHTHQYTLHNTWKTLHSTHKQTQTHTIHAHHLHAALSLPWNRKYDGGTEATLS